MSLGKNAADRKDVAIVERILRMYNIIDYLKNTLFSWISSNFAILLFDLPAVGTYDIVDGYITIIIYDSNIGLSDFKNKRVST